MIICPRKNLFIIIAQGVRQSVREALTMSENSAREADLVLFSERGKLFRRLNPPKKA